MSLKDYINTLCKIFSMVEDKIKINLVNAGEDEDEIKNSFLGYLTIMEHQSDFPEIQFKFEHNLNREELMLLMDCLSKIGAEFNVDDISYEKNDGKCTTTINFSLFGAYVW